MNTKRRKQRLIKAKQYAFGKRFPLSSPHLFDNETEHSWCDFHFKYGGKLISVTFLHPISHYSDECENKAYELAGPMPDWSFNSKPTSFKKLGRSRKKPLLFSCGPLPVSNKDYCKEWAQLHQEVLRDHTNGIEVKPFAKIHQTNYGKWVELCVPISIIYEKELEVLKELTISFMKLGNAAFGEFGDYSFTAKDYIVKAGGGRGTNWN